MTPAELPPSVGEVAVPQGYACFAAPEDLGLAWRGLDGLVAVLRDFPRDETAILLSALSTRLHAFGESSAVVQLVASNMLPEASRPSASAWLGRYPNGMVLTYEAAVRLSLLAMHFGDPAPRDLSEAEATTVLGLLPEAQALLSRYDGAEAPPRTGNTTEIGEAWAFLLFLTVNSPAMGRSQKVTLDAMTLGSLAASHVAAGLRGKAGKVAVRRLHQALGGDVAEVHAVATYMAGHFVHGERKDSLGKRPTHLIDLDALRLQATRAGDIGVRFLESLVAGPINPDAFGPGSAFGPPAALPAGLRSRPFLRWGARPSDLAAWDVRGLFALLGGQFADVLRNAVGGASGDVLSGAWDDAIEDAFDELVTPLVPTWSPLPALPGQNCDRWFADGDDLFLVEIKNVRPGSALSVGTAHDFKNWLRSKFFAKEGFQQIDATAASLDRLGIRLGGKKVRRYRAIWPIILSWVRFSGHAYMTDLLARLADERERDLPDPVRRRMRPPVVIDYDTFATITNCLPALRDLGISLGQVFEAFHIERVDRPLTLGEFTRRLVPDAKVPPEATNMMGVALERADAVGARLKGEAWPGATGRV